MPKEDFLQSFLQEVYVWFYGIILFQIQLQLNQFYKINALKFVRGVSHLTKT
jgi:hypothetical protein